MHEFARTFICVLRTIGNIMASSIIFAWRYSDYLYKTTNLAPMAKRVYHLMIKPAGARCNLACRYCYYIGNSGQYSALLSEDLLHRCLKDYLQSTDAQEPSVCWHGGEPLLAGMAFYQKALEIEKRYAAGRRILNTIQTNGTLLDSEWCSFFADNGFLVGVSLDGPEDLHDSSRTQNNGTGSFASTMHAIDLLRKAGAKYNTLSVVHSASEGRGAEIYRFLRDEAGSRYMQFLPVEGHALSARGYGAFLCDVFDVWAHGDIGKVFVQSFDATLARWCGYTPGLCTMGERCGDNLSVECNGDVYACDHFTGPAHRLGNLTTNSLSDLYDCNQRLRFTNAKMSGLSSGCRDCQWFHICNGGCPKQRDKDGKNALCEGLKDFYQYVSPAMDKMRKAIMG